jgi:NadR type nicotinamide-nucleotide adenylyltransferase
MEKALEQQPSNCIKVVLFGPESTGKTTLSKALADHFDTLWVAEYAREYLQNKWDLEQKTCEPSDLLPIAVGQMQLENTTAAKTNELLFCDTNLLETKVYSEVYYDGYCDPTINHFAKKNYYNLYFLCDIDVPWVADDLRDKPNERKKMFLTFERALQKQGLSYELLSGSKTERLKNAVNHINQLLTPKI